jgi:Fe-S oxidoreductase
VANSGLTVGYQDPFALARDLEETEEARTVIAKAATLHEMLCNRKETIWAGDILMAQYMPDVINLVAKRRLFNVTSIGENAVVTASVSEYTALKNAATDVTVLSIEDLILGE